MPEEIPPQPRYPALASPTYVPSDRLHAILAWDEVQLDGMDGMDGSSMDLLDCSVVLEYNHCVQLCTNVVMHAQ